MIAALTLVVGLAAPPVDQLDRWIVAAKGAPTIVVVPRAGALLEPLGEIAKRLPETPDSDASFELLDPEAHAANGLDLDGPIFFAQLAPHPVLIAGVRDAEGYLRALGTTPTPHQVLGAPGFKTTEGLALVRDGLLYVSQSEAAIKRFVEAPFVGPAGLASCADPPGEADGFVLSESPFGRACGTVRIDADRLRIQLRTPVGAQDPTIRWLADGDEKGLWRRLGADATTIGFLNLTRSALAKVGGDFGQLARSLDGRIAFGIGASTDKLTAVLGVADAAQVDGFLRQLMREANGPFSIVESSPRTWRIENKRTEMAGLKVPTTAWVRLTEGELVLTTDATRLDGTGEAFGGTRAEIDRKTLFGEGAPVAFLWHRTGGRPHDGVALADALAASLTFFEIKAEELRAITSAWALVGARIGDWAISLRRSNVHVTAALEVILL